MKKLTYSLVGDDYGKKDPIKKLAQVSAKATAVNLKKHGYQEISGNRGESAYVWQQENILMASAIEGLGTKNLVADKTEKITHKNYYHLIGHDTVATIINDLISVGATPLVLHAYWTIGDNSWLNNKERLKDFISGWQNTCNLAGVSWGGGETPTLKSIVFPKTIDLGGSAIGIIKPKKRLVSDINIQTGDRILLLKSTGINANGLSLARSVAKNLPRGYASPLPNDQIFGEALLNKTNIYACLFESLFKAGIKIHYLSNITGHGLRKIMRGRPNFTYVIEKIIPPPAVFVFIQKQAKLTDYEMFQTFNMGMDYAIYLPEKEVGPAQTIIQQCQLESLNAGYVHKGKKQVVIKPKNLVYNSRSMDLR